MSPRSAYETHAADGMKALGAVYAYVLKSGLSRTLIDLVFLRASQLNGCAYCIDLHTRDLLRAGTPVEKLALLPAWREGGAHFSSEERAALAWAEAVTLVTTTHVSDADYADAASMFDEKALADLTIAVGVINAYNRMAIAFRRAPAGA